MGNIEFIPTNQSHLNNKKASVKESSKDDVTSEKKNGKKLLLAGIACLAAAGTAAVLISKGQHKQVTEAIEETTDEIISTTTNNKAKIQNVISEKIAFLKPATKEYSIEDKKNIVKWLDLDNYQAENVLAATNEQMEIYEKCEKILGFHCNKRLFNEYMESIFEIKDKNQLEKLNYLADLPGFSLKDLRSYDDYSIKKVLELEPNKFERVAELAKRGVPCEKSAGYYARYGDKSKLFKPIELPAEKFQRLINIKDNCLNCEDYYMKDILDLDEDNYKKLVDFAEKYYCGLQLDYLNFSAEKLAACEKAIENGASAHAFYFDKLSCSEIESITDLMKKGYSFNEIQSAIYRLKQEKNCTFNYEQIESACRKYVDEISNANSAKFSWNDLKNPEKLAEFCKLNNCDFETREQIPYAWRTKYVGGGGLAGLTKELQDELIERGSVGRYRSENGQPMARWIYPECTYSFIENFPAEGEIYAPNKMQSFAKTLHGAERYRGNNFSDTNLDKNVKFIVHPKEELSMAYDIGEGKYGADEAIYKASQKFKVIKKGWQTVQNPAGDGRMHKLYVIEMNEI